MGKPAIRTFHTILLVILLIWLSLLLIPSIFEFVDDANSREYYILAASGLEEIKAQYPESQVFEEMQKLNYQLMDLQGWEFINKHSEKYDINSDKFNNDIKSAKTVEDLEKTYIKIVDVMNQYRADKVREFIKIDKILSPIRTILIISIILGYIIYKGLKRRENK